MLVEAGCDTAELLELAEEALDQVAPTIEVGRDRPLPAHAALGRDVRSAAARGDPFDQGHAVIPAIRDDRARRQRIQQERRRCLVRRLSLREVQPDRQPVLIDDGVDLGAQSATRTANGVILAPFFPPVACWWARTMELSINCSDCGERRASSSNTFSQIPRFAQRLKRL